MRIISGELKTRSIKAPKGQEFRPTTDRVKENVFNILGERTRGANVMDLYAGSGSLGIEALSRGAKRALFIDNSKEAAEVIKKNLEDLNIDNKADVIKGDAVNELRRLVEGGFIFDLIFLDPPYNIEVVKLRDIFTLLAKCFSSSGLIVFESGTDLSDSLVASIKEIDKREYGSTKIYFLKKTG